MSTYNPERAKLRRIKLYDAGICICCRKQPHVTEGGICGDCREYQRVSSNARLAKFRLTNPPKTPGSRPGIKRGPYKARILTNQSGCSGVRPE